MYVTEHNTPTDKSVPGTTGSRYGGALFWPAFIDTAVPGCALRDVNGTVVQAT